MHRSFHQVGRFIVLATVISTLAQGCSKKATEGVAAKPQSMVETSNDKTQPAVTKPSKSEKSEKPVPRPRPFDKTVVAKTVPNPTPKPINVVQTPPEQPITPTIKPSPTPPQVRTSESLDDKLAKLVVPAPWLADVTPKWDTNKPWKEGRIEIRRLLGLNREDARREAITLTWMYLQKDDIGNAHEYPMYMHLGGEPVWAVYAFRWFLKQPHDNPPVYAMEALAAVYRDFGEYKLAEAQLNNALQNLPKPPWRVMRQADFHSAFGDLYARMGDVDKAKTHYRKAIELYPTARPPYGGHLLPRRAKKVQSKLDLLSYSSLANTSLKDGVYNEQALGYSGVIDLAVTVSEGRIANIDIKHKEKIEQNAVVIIPQRIISKQSLQVDGISGATVTKQAIVAGTYRALKKAGLD